MVPVTTADRRRMRAVVLLLPHGLCSLSLGKVLVSTALLWLAATYLTTSEESTDTVVALENENTRNSSVEFIAYSTQDADSADNSGTSTWLDFLAGGGEKPSQVNSRGQRVATGLDGHVATMATATRARSLAELRARHQPVATKSVATQSVVATQPAATQPVATQPEWPFLNGHGAQPADGHAHDRWPTATAAGQAPSTKVLVGVVKSITGPVFEYLSGLVDRMVGATTGDSASLNASDREPRAVVEHGAAAGHVRDTPGAIIAQAGRSASEVAGHRTWMTASDTNATPTMGSDSGREATADRVGNLVHERLAVVEQVQRWVDPVTAPRAAIFSIRPVTATLGRAGRDPVGRARRVERADLMMDGFVDLVSGIVTTAAGERAAAHTQRALAEVTGPLGLALEAARELPTDPNGFGAGLRGHLTAPERSPKSMTPVPALAPDGDNFPIVRMGRVAPIPTLAWSAGHLAILGRGGIVDAASSPSDR